MFDFGILGINARNLRYITKLNSREAIRLADNKLRTKNFLQAQEIPVPETFGLIRNREDLVAFDFLSLPDRSFVIKPNHGSKGQGIMIVRDVLPPSDGDGLRFLIQGKTMDKRTFDKHLCDILDGQFSLRMGPDSVLIEERLIPGYTFERFCAHGLADIRVILVNLVPVAAMIRMPTAGSGGKANLAQGGVGLGIEIGSGVIRSLMIGRRVYTHSFPEDFALFYGKQIPFWDDILLLSSRMQDSINLGYLAFDWVITSSGPKILEINARAGLEIQNVCLLPLKKRLSKIEDVDISTPEKGYEISRALFTKKISHISASKVLYLSQSGTIITEKSGENSIPVTINVDLSHNENHISEALANTFPPSENGLTIEINGNIIDELAFIVDPSLKSHELVLGREDIGEFYVRPVYRKPNIFLLSPSCFYDEEKTRLHILDEKLHRIARRIKLSTILKPNNYLTEFDRFIEKKGKYNPVFHYAFPTPEETANIKQQLLELRDTYCTDPGALRSDFADVFRKKMHELLLKLELISAYHDQAYERIAQYNTDLFGEHDADLLETAVDRAESYSEREKNSDIEYLPLEEVVAFIQAYTREKGFEDVKVGIDPTNISRLSFTKKGVLEIRVSNLAQFTKQTLLAALAHEVDTHMVRYVNGRKSGWSIIREGTGFYLADEEGLAIYQSRQVYQKNEESVGMYVNYVITHEAAKLDFQKIAEYARDVTNKSLERSFSAAIRIKRGIIDTSIVHAGTVYLKDKVYYDGFVKVRDWIEAGGEIERLLVGKITIEDLEYLE